MASFKIEKAIVKFVGQTTQVSDSFKKRELIIGIDNDSQYPQTIKVEAAQAQCDDNSFNEIRPGDEINVYINLRGREYNNTTKGIVEIFNTLQYWKMEIVRTTGQQPQQPPQYQQPQQQQGYGAPQQQQYQQPPVQQQQYAQPQQQQYQAPQQQAPQQQQSYAPAPQQTQQFAPPPQQGYGGVGPGQAPQQATTFGSEPLPNSDLPF